MGMRNACKLIINRLVPLQCVKCLRLRSGGLSCPGRGDGLTGCLQADWMPAS
jgi:hypothetical protein